MPFDYVQGAGPSDVDIANQADIGDITLPQGSDWVIQKVRAAAVNVGTDAQSKPLIGYIYLRSKHCNVEPFAFPFSPTPSHLGATPHSSREPAMEFIVNCPAPAGAVIECYCVLGVGAPQAAPEVFVEIEFGRGVVGDGTQVHMEVLEPSGGLSTSDNGTTTMSTITLTNARKMLMVWAVASVATLVADESVIVGMEITCPQWRTKWPLKFFLEPQEGGDATTSGTHLIVRVVHEERDFDNAPTTAVLTPKTTQYDANNAAPECYVGVAYV